VYFPTVMLMPLHEDLDRRARRAVPRSSRPAYARSRRTRPPGTLARTALRARSAVTTRTAAAGPAGARS
jgi:hypothetical protein